MSVNRKDSLTTFIVCLVMGGFVFSDTLRYPEVQGQGFGQGPAFYPQLLAGVLIFLGALTLVLDLAHADKGESDNGRMPTGEGVTYLPVTLIMILTVVMIIVMTYFGFFISGFLLTFLSVLLIRGSDMGKHLLPDLGFSVGMIILVYLVFQVFVGIQLPEAALF